MFISPLHMPSQNYHCSIPPTYSIPAIIKSSTCRKSRGERFWIIPSDAQSEHKPTILLTGSFGNLYRFQFTKDFITCSCDDNFSRPCKHILFILLAINYKVKPGDTFLQPLHILELLRTTSLFSYQVDKKTADLCLSHMCPTCTKSDDYLSGTITTCNRCNSPFHHQCVINDNICPHCRYHQPTFLNSSLITRHRNLFNILFHRKYYSSAAPPNKNIIQNFARNIDGSGPIIMEPMQQPFHPTNTPAVPHQHRCELQNQFYDTEIDSQPGPNTYFNNNLPMRFV